MNDSEQAAPIRVVGVCGSLNPTGKTRAALSVALKGSAEYEAETRLIELRDYELVFYGSVRDDGYPEDVHRLRQELREAQGIIIATPEYHGSLSGALKNMFDLMSTEEFEAKIVGLIGVAGGQVGAIHSLNSMKNICRNLHCWVLPQEVSIAESGRVIGDDGSVIDKELEERLLNIGRQLVKFASLQKEFRQTEFAKVWAELPTW
jgi:FMN reductase